MTTDADVVQALRELAQHLPSTSTEDLSPLVLETLREEQEPPARPRSARLVLAVVAACLALITALGLFAPVRDAAATMLRLVGVDIQRAEQGARPPAPSPPAPSDLGVRISVDAVSMAAGFDVPTPHTLALGGPDEAYLTDGGTYEIVTLVWRERAAVPVAPASSASVLLSVFHGAPPDREYLEKILYEGAHAHRVSVNGDPGVFVTGPQAVVYAGRDFEMREAPSRLSANSLIWQRSGLTLRLESALGEDASVALAGTVG